jgi:hypothetical protein
MITVANVLRATATVSSAISIDIFVSLRDVEVYEANICDAVEFRVDPSDNGHAIMTAQGPTVPSDDKTVDSNEEVQPEAITEIAKPESNVPYAQSERKFPMIVRDILELPRRYYRVFLPWVRQTVQINDATNYIYFYPVTFMHPISNIYGSWAGSLNYIIYVSNSGSWLDEFGFTPSTELKYDSETQGMKDLSGRWVMGNAITSQSWYCLAKTSTTFKCSRQGVASAAIPREIPVTSGTARYVSVSVPFNTIHETLPTMPYRYTGELNMGISTLSNESGISPIIGYLWFLSRRTSVLSGGGMDFYQSIGDDFRLYNPRPANALFLPYTDAGSVSETNLYVSNEFRFQV